jgi:hypothetical protein
MSQIERLLNMWGAWANERPALHIKPVTIYGDSTPRPASRATMPDDDAAIFDPCVSALADYDRGLYELIKSRYLYSMPYAEIAKLHNISKIAAQRGIETGGAYIFGYWQARVIALDIASKG